MLDVTKLHELEQNVVVIMCHLAKIFSPTSFYSMKHHIVHLPYGVRLGGSVQYKWMYPFKRFLYDLKMKMKTKAHVKASIVEAYTVVEIGYSLPTTLSYTFFVNETGLAKTMISVAMIQNPTVYFQSP
ncbi:UNVERIFIED_CONTAM: hypothetical protein Slati_2985900 [Sesamum latifolium]|uniref:DUF4218 domain-containing protein n=1 Tax=Sesamum latifolium TaxID=2727402 RepID=A0AAW2VK47_9LAMI